VEAALALRPRLQAWRAFRAWARELRAQEFDLVIDPQGLFKSGLCGWLSGAPLRVSLWPREGNQLFVHDCVRPAIPPGPERIISFEYRALAAAVGAPDFRLDLAVGEAPASGPPDHAGGRHRAARWPSWPLHHPPAEALGGRTLADAGRSALGRRLPARDPGRTGRPGRAERIASQEPGSST
jgi:heptosyltransferase-1